MTLLLSIFAVFAAVIAAFMPMLPAFFLRIGLLPIYRLRLLRAVFLITAWALAIAAYLTPRPPSGPCPFVFILSIPTIVLEPRRIFVTLDDPEHVPAPQADFQGEALVLGYTDEENALAWPFETLAPRHLINDQSGDTPLLVAY